MFFNRANGKSRFIDKPNSLWRNCWIRFTKIIFGEFIMVRFVKSFFIAVIVSILCPAITSFADVKLPAIVGDSMVLQQQTEVNVWGWADPDEKITLSPSWDERKYTCVAGKDGKWYNTVIPLNREIKDEIDKIVLEAYGG